MTITLASTTQTAEQLQETLDRAEQRRNPSFGEVAEPEKVESAETVTESPAVESEETEEHEQKPSKRSQKIKRLAEKLSAAERERDEWREKAERSQSGRTEQPKQVTTSSEDDPEPDAAKYASPQEYLRDWARWNGRQERKQQAAEQQATTQRQAIIEHNARLEEFKAEHEDFDVVVNSANFPIPDIPETKPLQAAIQQALWNHPEGPEIMYYLGKNPKALTPFANMNSVWQIKAYVDELADRATSAPKQSSPLKPRPKLPTPLAGGTVSIEPEGKRSFRDHKQARQSGSF